MASVMVTLPLQLLCQLVGSVPGSTDSICGGTHMNKPPLQVQFANLPSGYIAYPDIGVAYKVHDDMVSWQVARKECILEGGQLALIDSYRKLEYVMRQRHSKNLTHVGIQRMYDDEEWVSDSTRLPVSVIPWADGEPSGHWDCVMIKDNEHGLGNFKCTDRGDFVCELPIPEKYIVRRDPMIGKLSID